MAIVQRVNAVMMILLLAFVSQGVAATPLHCDMLAKVGNHVAYSHDTYKTAESSMTMAVQPNQTASHCADCDCPFGGCSLIVPTDALSYEQYTPESSNLDYPETSELEPVSLLYRPPISR